MTDHRDGRVARIEGAAGLGAHAESGEELAGRFEDVGLREVAGRAMPVDVGAVDVPAEHPVEDGPHLRLERFKD